MFAGKFSVPGYGVVAPSCVGVEGFDERRLVVVDLVEEGEGPCPLVVEPRFFDPGGRPRFVGAAIGPGGRTLRVRNSRRSSRRLSCSNSAIRASKLARWCAGLASSADSAALAPGASAVSIATIAFVSSW